MKKFIFIFIGLLIWLGDTLLLLNGCNDYFFIFVVVMLGALFVVRGVVDDMC